MTEFNIRRRKAEDGQSPDEIEDAIREIAEQRFDERRDREAEDLYREKS